MAFCYRNRESAEWQRLKSEAGTDFANIDHYLNPDGWPASLTRFYGVYLCHKIKKEGGGKDFAPTEWKLYSFPTLTLLSDNRIFPMARWLRNLEFANYWNDTFWATSREQIIAKAKDAEAADSLYTEFR